MTEEEKLAFVRKGRETLTAFAFAARVLGEWTESYDQRSLTNNFGPDAAEIAGFSNALTKGGFLDATWRGLIARLRTDI